MKRQTLVLYIDNQTELCRTA